MGEGDALLQPCGGRRRLASEDDEEGNAAAVRELDAAALG
jgi:hypothetical protein